MVIGPAGQLAVCRAKARSWIIIIIILTPVLNSQGMKKYAMQYKKYKNQLLLCWWIQGYDGTNWVRHRPVLSFVMQRRRRSRRWLGITADYSITTAVAVVTTAAAAAELCPHKIRQSSVLCPAVIWHRKFILSSTSQNTNLTELEVANFKSAKSNRTLLRVVRPQPNNI